jgi:hypothetical protein
LTVRKALLIRFLICIAAGILLAIPVSELGFLMQGNTTSRPAKTVKLDIPPGTSAKVAQGVSILPQDMIFVLGDTLVVNNRDSVAHTLGPLFIPPGSSASLTLNHIGNLSYVCTFQPTKYQGLDVQDALTLATRLEGILIAGIPLGMLFALYSLIVRPLKKASPAPLEDPQGKV